MTRDQAHSRAHEPEPVFSTDGDSVGKWPPIATYPSSLEGFKGAPSVSVELTFRSPEGTEAVAKRALSSEELSEDFDPRLNLPQILIETGMAMPTRLGQLRLDEGRGRLTDAIQRLTGLDELAAIGELANGLCNKGREYLRYANRQNLEQKHGEFLNAVAAARDVLATVNVEVPDFSPLDTDPPDGEMAQLGVELKERAAAIAETISNDLNSSLNLDDPNTQSEVQLAVSKCLEDLELALNLSGTWSNLILISDSLSDEAVAKILTALDRAERELSDSVKLLDRSASDTRFRLKALAARWHAEHSSGPIDECPLCEQTLRERPELKGELESLRSTEQAATRNFLDNLNAISTELDGVLPIELQSFIAMADQLLPQESITSELRAALAHSDRSVNYLVGFSQIAQEHLNNIPGEEFTKSAKDHGKLPEEALPLATKLSNVRYLLEIGSWFSESRPNWERWWNELAGVGAEDGTETPSEEQPSASENGTNETLFAHLRRLSSALSEAEPYRIATQQMSGAWQAGKQVAAIQREQSYREKIAEQLKPLKDLAPFVESVAREAITSLSARISEILKDIYISERLDFRDARLERRKGVVVRGGFDPEFQIDATLVANTSWLRAVLWAFVFALREDAVEQIGSDPLPLLLLDDPQSTFDVTHRHRWARYISSMQNRELAVQVILATHDETFLEQIRDDGVTGRQAMIAAARPDLGSAGIFEGDALDREWERAEKINTPKAGQEYLASIRVYVEAMLKRMLRGEDPNVPNMVLGNLRELMRQRHDAAITPWNKSPILELVRRLDKGRSEIRYIERAHHSTGNSLGMSEAVEVKNFWEKQLRSNLERGFRLVRNHLLLHGDLKALHLDQPRISMPDGHGPLVADSKVKLVGRAAALTDGRSADGLLAFDELSISKNDEKNLGGHWIFRLTAPTLEPVARPGDLLLVSEFREPTPKSLVVAAVGDQILARRFQMSANHSDVAVLAAQSINPRSTPPPVVAHVGSIRMYKVVGVIFDPSADGSQAQAGMEITDCGGESAIRNVLPAQIKLVEVEGMSAEPIALHEQGLIVSTPITEFREISRLDGRPVIARDVDQNPYFKRLRNVGNQSIVLESLDSGGEFPPVVLSLDNAHPKALVQLWPVLGVLFDRPDK